MGREGGMEERGECHIPVTSKTHSQWGYNGQDLSRTGNHFGEIRKVEKRRVERSWARGKGQQSAPKSAWKLHVNGHICAENWSKEEGEKLYFRSTGIN